MAELPICPKCGYILEDEELWEDDTIKKEDNEESVWICPIEGCKAELVITCYFEPHFYTDVKDSTKGMW